MMPNHPSDFVVVIDVLEDPLANHRMLLHDPPLLECERARFL